jgi:uncharacterized OB-fold protein
MNNLLSELGLSNREYEKKKDTLKPKVTIGHRCERCGVIFARSHPKDPQRYCERCRDDNKK